MSLASLQLLYIFYNIIYNPVNENGLRWIENFNPF